MITIVPANHGKALKHFLRLPRQLYVDLDGYEPPLDVERSEMLHPKKAHFFQRGEAQYFLAYQDQQPVGRISAQVDERHRTRPGNADIGFFGCLDAVDDRAVIMRLVECAADWLRQRGVSKLQGPYLLSVNGEPGLMSEGQERRAMVFAPWHPRYLADHLDGLGLKVVKTLHYYYLDLVNRDLQNESRLGRILDRQTGLTVRGLRMNRLDEEAGIVVGLYNDAWFDNWGFVPLEDGEIHQLLKTLKPLLHPDAGIIIEEDGHPVACTVIIPNVSELVGDLGGQPSLLGWLKFAKRLVGKDFSTGRIILMGIAKEYRRSSKSATLLLTMMGELSRRHRRHELSGVEAGWVLEDNTALIKLLEQFKLPVCRKYQIYESDITQRFL